jgi:hypothetical protein
VGTSNAFGGSTVWSDTSDQWISAATGAEGTAATAAPPAPLIQAIGKALGRGDRRGKSFGVADLISSRRGGAGSSGSGDGRDSGASPTFTRQAARGALVLGALRAIENGETPELESFGLDFSALHELTGRELLAALIQLILGSPSHPEDVALQRSLQAALQAEAAGSPSSMRDLVGRFVSGLAWQTALVQITALGKGQAPPKGGFRALEQRMKTYIAGKVNRIGELLVSSSPQVLANYASTLAAKVCKAFRSETGAI